MKPAYLNAEQRLNNYLIIYYCCLLKVLYICKIKSDIMKYGT